ncbi:Adenosine deaminase [Gracilariopsis chorda]|uniref:adenosine deaminase n=1 Tax=Gracilariopsis chorda TaxID=448386 RepID=A0A2V3IIX0_9FLOR|nr:Adenosine deaminase [Gracilariopsis chorda]|eukprot:PXF42044.1 Adenosine deaminase [Gracilariopsis chorda]
MADHQHVRAVAARLPKVQLHLHLDGSLSEHFIAERAAARGVALPCAPSALRRFLVAAKQRHVATNSHSQPRNANWPVFDFCNRFLQTEHELCDATRQLVSELVRLNTWVIELRFCPLLHLNEGLSPHQVVAAVVRGYRTAVQHAPLPFGVRGGIILCALRSHDAHRVRQVCELAKSWLGRGVIALDLAGDEPSYPLRTHAHALLDARQSGVPLTIHAGEGFFEASVDNVLTALEIGAHRIGHGLVIASSDELCSRMRSTYIETCITANCNSEQKVKPDRFDLHPVRTFIRRGLKVAAFNCDNMLLSGTVASRSHPVEELVRAKTACALGWTSIAEVLLNGARASFDPSIFGSATDSHFISAFKEAVEAILEPPALKP